ncbi:hypothetical protein BaRGS_00014837, partial [Batillaria attramentaria]
MCDAESRDLTERKSLRSVAEKRDRWENGGISGWGWWGAAQLSHREPRGGCRRVLAVFWSGPITYNLAHTTDPAA